MAEVDERYKRGIIYTIRNITDDTMVYVGSSINNLSKRFNTHKVDCKSGKKGKSCSLQSCIEYNDWTNFYIELYENYPCNSKKELERREGQVIREIGTINKNIAGRTKKEYLEENAEKIKEIKNKYYEKNIDKIKEYRNENIDKIKEQKKKYREENADKIRVYNKEYRNEKVCCSICGGFSTKNHLPRHQKSKKCMSSRTK